MAKRFLPIGPVAPGLPPGEIDVGGRLRVLRTGRGLSMRALAKKSGLNVNTLSLIENQHTSPSVSTLQQLALALNVPLTAFFEVDIRRSTSYFKRPASALGLPSPMGRWKTSVLV